MAEKKDQTLMYKGLPLVRSGNTLYYGDPEKKYIIRLEVLSTKPSGDLQVATKVRVELMYTDPDLRAKDKVLKKSERGSLYEAMDFGQIWLSRALAEK